MTDAELIAGMRARKDAGSKLAADRIEALIGEREVWKDRAMQVQDERDEVNNQLIAALARVKVVV